jgi:hypothetical protein
VMNADKRSRNSWVTIVTEEINTMYIYPPC